MEATTTMPTECLLASRTPFTGIGHDYRCAVSGTNRSTALLDSSNNNAWCGVNVEGSKMVEQAKNANFSSKMAGSGDHSGYLSLRN